MKFSVEVYDAWHSLWLPLPSENDRQFGVAAGQSALTEHVLPELMPSGSVMPLPSGFSTWPHTGQPSMPEQSGSWQSTRPSPSLSTMSVQTSGPEFVLPESAWPSSSPKWSLRHAGPHATANKRQLVWFCVFEVMALLFGLCLF